MAISTRHRRLIKRFLRRLEAAAMTDDRALLDGFILWSGRNSAFTRDAYTRDILAFAGVLQRRRVKLLEVGPEDVDAFCARLEAVRPKLKPSSFNRKLWVVRSFYRYAADLYPDLDLPNPVLHRQLRQLEKQLPRPVSEDLLAQLLDGITHLRDQALFLMYLQTGLRLRALLSLNLGDLKHEYVPNRNGEDVFLGSVVVLDKGRKQRVVYFTKRAWQALKAYLKTRRVTARSPLFVNRRGERLSPRGVEDRLTTWCRRVGVAHITIHQLRHTLATMLLRHGAQLEVVQRILGHQSIRTTLRYTLIEDAAVRDAYNQAMNE